MESNKLVKRINLFTFLILLIVLASCSTTSKYSKSKNLSHNFSNQQLTLIRSAGPEMPLRVFKTTNKSDSILLRSKSTKVDVSKPDEDLNLFIDRLYATVRDSMSLGVGIAAPQVGLLKNIIWVQRFDKENFPFEVYINPVITNYSDKKQDCMEGCLSIPDKQAITKSRAYEIVIEYDKQDGSHHIETVNDFTAVVFQHEIDHLLGKLFTDYLE